MARAKGSSRMLKVLRKAARGALELNDSPARLRVVAFGRRLELEAEQLADIRRAALGGTAPVNLLRPRARKLLLDALWEQSGAAGRHTDPELAAELRSSFDEDIASEDSFLTFLDAWWPELAAVLDAMADERRLGRWARRILNPGEIRKVARSLKREGRSVHDIAMLDELQAILGAPARPRKRRELDPLDQLTGLEELMPVREESQRERAERLAQERTEYAHVIVDGPGPHPDAVAHGRPPWPARHLDGRRRPGPVLLVRPGRGRRPATRPSAPARAAA
ncbi:UvrD-like helicase ATP-binding domain-containing protein OS=Streptomyces violarus OX=67380 GN=FHS41_003984 PE=4 SV=1 [Streptomyces violarus]